MSGAGAAEGSESVASSRPGSVAPPLGGGGGGGGTGVLARARSSTGGRSKEPLDLSEYKAAGNGSGRYYIKGELKRDVHGDHVFRGHWALSHGEFHAPNGVKSEIELKHKSLDPDDTELFPFGGQYQGWLKLKEGPKMRERKEEEPPVQLTFQRHNLGGCVVRRAAAFRLG